MSFVNATLVLSIGDTVEEVTDSGFLGTTPTLSCSALGDDALVQVYPDGIRHIRADKRVNEWKAPGKKTITKCAVNQRQVVIALSGGELVYFEMDPVSLGVFEKRGCVEGFVAFGEWVREIKQDKKIGICKRISFRSFNNTVPDA